MAMFEGRIMSAWVRELILAGCAARPRNGLPRGLCEKKPQKKGEALDPVGAQKVATYLIGHLRGAR